MSEWKPMQARLTDATVALFGHGTFMLDKRAALQSQRIVALGKAREARDAMRLARRCLKDIDQIRWWGEWEDALADARDELRHWLGAMRRDA